MRNSFHVLWSKAVILIFCLPLCASALQGDFNGDNVVNWSDLGIMSDQWLAAGTADIDGSGIVDNTDFSYWSQNWLDTYTPIATQSWWKLDETTGTTAADSSGNGHNGTLKVETGEQVANGFLWQPSGGVVGGAIRFDGDGPSGENPQPRIEIPTTGMSPAAGTVALWVNLADPVPVNDDNRSGNIYFFGAYSSSADRIQLSTYSGAKLRYTIGSESYAGTAGYQFTRGQWTHIAIIWSSGNYTVYVDGALNTSGTYNASTFDVLPATAEIGNSGDTNKGVSMHGLIDDVRIYNQQLTADEVFGIYGGASNPSPANGAINVPNNKLLNWSAGSGATSHNVYFGTTNPPIFRIGTTNGTYNPGGLSYASLYYWRIDEVKAGGVVIAGKVWSFSTLYPPAAASGPVPSNTAASVGLTTDLSWTAGSGAASHDVYFGTANPPSFAVNQTAVVYDTGTMDPEVTYYWRINERNAAGVTAGALWSFTTTARRATNPVPANGATSVSITAGLSWTAGFGATSRDVYFGSTNPLPLAVSNITVTNYQLPTLSYSTQYYWQVDEKSSAGVATGQLWSFTTVPPPPPPGKATVLSPVSGAIGISLNPALSWTAGTGATSHNVYFGDSNPPSFVVTQTSTSYTAGPLLNDTTYYWRIDGTNYSGTTAGDLWSFTTVSSGPPSQASGPSPASGATNVSQGVILSWTAGAGATSHNVYLGSGGSLTFRVNTASTAFSPTGLAASTTYSWRIDEVNTAGATTGAVWEFTTIAAGPPEQAYSPSPANSAADTGVYATLKWSAGSGATSHNVYFGTSSSPAYQTNTTSTIFVPSDLLPLTAYYWRIDEVNAMGATTGQPWTFTTSNRTYVMFEDTSADLGNTHPHLFMHGYGTTNGWWSKVSSNAGYQEIWNRITAATGDTTDEFEAINAAFAYTLSKQDAYGTLCKTLVTSLKIPPGKETDYRRCLGPAAYALAFDAIADGTNSSGTPWLTSTQRSAALNLIATTLIDLGGTNGDDMYGDWEYKSTHNFFQSAFSGLAACAYVLRGESGYEALSASAIAGVKRYHNWRVNGNCKDVSEWKLWQGPMTGDGFPFEGPQYGAYTFIRGMYARHIIEMNEYPNPPTVVDENLHGFFTNYSNAWMSLVPAGLNTWVKVIKSGSEHGGTDGFRFCAALNWISGNETQARVSEWFAQWVGNAGIGDSMNAPSLEFMWYNQNVTPLSPVDAGLAPYMHLDDSELHVYRDSWDLTSAPAGEMYVYFRNNAHHGRNYWDEGQSDGTAGACTSQTSSHDSADNGNFCIYKKDTGYIINGYAAEEGNTNDHTCLQIDGQGIRMAGNPTIPDRGHMHPEFANLDCVGAVDSAYGHAIDAIIGPAYTVFDYTDLNAYRRYFFVIRDPMYVISIDDIEPGHTAKFIGQNTGSGELCDLLYPQGATFSGTRPLNYTTTSPHFAVLCHPTPAGVTVTKNYADGDLIAGIGSDTVVYNPDASTFTHGSISGNALLFAERTGGAIIFKATAASGTQYGVNCDVLVNMSVSGNQASIYVYGQGMHTVTVTSPYGTDVFDIEAGKTVLKSL